MRGHVPPVEAVEIFLASGLDLVCRTFDLSLPFRSTADAYVLVDFASDEDRESEQEAMVSAMEGVTDVAVAQDLRSRERLWRYRELHTDAIATVGVPHKLDVAVPPGSLGDFIEEVPRVVSSVAPHAETWMFGHGGESSLHVNVIGPPSDDFAVDEALLRLVASMNGSISAEHGIGRAKLPWIALVRSAEELRVIAGVKKAFDPRGIMNPGVLVPVS
jgi:FAD/FMN-containing dehydrogenase